MTNKQDLLFASIMAVGAMAQHGSAAAPGSPVYQGTAFVIGVSNGCSASGPAFGDSYTMLYRQLPEAGNKSYGGGVAFVTPTSSVSYVLPAGVALTGGHRTYSNVAAHGQSSDVGPFDYAGSLDLTIAPATVTSSTPSVYITGTVGDMFGYAGCNVAIRAALALRP